jgi:GNAT superfamily N-acetyltransferase
MVAVRPCTPSDHAAARTLLAAQLEEHHISTAPLDAALEGALADPSRALVLLAEDDATDEAIGVAYLAFNWTLEHGGRCAWLEELYVVPARRDAGVGTALLDAAFREAKAHGCLAVDLEVDADHARVESLYARSGFRRHARARWFKRLDSLPAR